MKDKELFLKLCDYRNVNSQEIRVLLQERNATTDLLGKLFVNRMAPVAYGVLKESNLLDEVDREFRNSLRNAAAFSEKQTDDYLKAVDMVSQILDKSGVNYALLKGAYLCGWYPRGYRTSNDIDVLVSPKDVTTISETLKSTGFVQGHIKNGDFVAATRSQIIESKMMRGETVPFLKKVDFPFMKYIEVDVNFSLDYKNGNDNVLESMLMNSIKREGVKTLDKYDFLLHLFAHLYKEATTIPWIRMKRDMTLYKYLDIYSLLFDFSSSDEMELISRAQKYEMITVTSYCIKSVAALFNLECKLLIEEMKLHDDETLDLVVAPTQKKTYRYAESDPKKRFFHNNRIDLLIEV